MRADRIVATGAPASVCIGQKQFSVARKVICRIITRLRSRKEKLIHGCSAETRRQQSGRFANLPANESATGRICRGEFLIFYRRIEWMIAPEQFLHHRCPKRCGCPHRKRVAHWSSIEISGPNGDGVFFVVANCPSVPE